MSLSVLRMILCWPSPRPSRRTHPADRCYPSCPKPCAQHPRGLKRKHRPRGPPVDGIQRLPWDVLITVCEYADHATLLQLCRVSLDMLEYAGPLLYRHVRLKTPRQLGCFLLTPTIIPRTSRLRPFLGYARCDTLHIDYRQLSDRKWFLFICFAVTIIWPRRRHLRFCGPVPLSTLRADLSEAALADNLAHGLVQTLLQPDQEEIFFHPANPIAEDALSADIEIKWGFGDVVARTGPSLSARLVQVDSSLGPNGVWIALEKLQRLDDHRLPEATWSTVTLDLRAFDAGLPQFSPYSPPPSPSASISSWDSIPEGVKDFTLAVLLNGIWGRADARLEIVVGADVIASYVEKAVAMSPASWDHKRHLCRVIRA